MVIHHSVVYFHKIRCQSPAYLKIILYQKAFILFLILALQFIIMKRIFFAVLFSLFTFLTNAQLSYQWANPAGSSANAEYGQAIASDPSGNVYVTGLFMGTVDFDPSAATSNLTSLSGSKDIFLAKYTSAGAFIWVKQIAGTNDEKPYDLVADATGAYLAGNFLGTVDFDPNAGTNNITFLGGGTDGDGFFAKYDVNGNLSWANRIGSTVNDRVTSIAIDASANVYITGFIGGNADMDPSAASASLNVSGTYNAYIGKYTSAGAYVYAKQITGGYSEGDDINLDASGNIYLTGSYATTNDFDPSAATANLSTSSLTQLDIFLAKYTNAGIYTFAKQIGGIGVDIGYQVVPDALGNIYLGGVFSSTCDFDPTATVNSLTSAGQGDLFVAKYDASGNLTWKTGTGGTTNDYCFGLGLDGSNNVYITGKVQGTNVDFDPSASSALLTSASSCMYIASYSSAGSFLSLSSPSIASVGNGICVNSSLYVTGAFAGTGDFDFSASTANLTSLGSDDVFFAKYNVCAGSPPVQPSVISGNTNPCYGIATTYSVTNDPLASSYTWTFPAGWTGSSTTNVSVPTVSNSGIITVIATNSCGAGPSRTLNVTAGGFSNAVITTTNVSCFGAGNGIATITYTGGAGPVSCLWSNSQTVFTATNLSAGIYSATLTDANGCNITKTVSITQPLQVLSSVNVTNASCFNMCNGMAIASVSNAIGPVSYSWMPVPASTQSVNNLCAGSYTVIAADQNNCGTTTIFNITQPPILSVMTGTIANANCPNQSNGSAQIVVSGGVPSYTYSWSPIAQTSSVLSNVPVGTYTCIVTDANNCQGIKTITIIVTNASPTVTASSSQSIICTGETATLTANGASTYSWNTSAAAQSITVSPAVNTTYTVTGFGSNGCSALATVTQSVSLCTGIDAIENKNEFVKIYPNPFSNEIVVLLNYIDEDTEISIYNSTGQLVYKVNPGQINSTLKLEYLPAGIYFLNISNKQQMQMVKLIKE